MINYKNLNKLLSEFSLAKVNMKSRDKKLIKVFISKGDYVYRIKFKDYDYESRVIYNRRIYITKETFEKHKYLEKLLLYREEKSFKII